ncbi:MAG: hypothetical protein FWE61_05340 [Micrococcales bacterium]|nr:hypothetical protein [Micrococcales bacterium]
MRSHTTARAGLVVMLVLGALTVGGLPGVAGHGAVHVSGRLVQVMANTGGDDDDLVAMLEVDGRLVALPHDVQVDGASGDQVTVTIEGAGRATGAAAVVAADDQSKPAVVVDVDVEPRDDGELLAASSTNTLTILPVYWTGSPPVPVSELRTLGEATARYWSTQSGGAISTSVVVKPWIDARTSSHVTVPTSCSNQAMAALTSQVIAANKYTAPSGSTGRVSVYFPRWSACGWAGLGTVGGPYSWINGYTTPEILAHEFGHNLGVGHANRYDCGRVALALPAASACSNREYGDTVDVMGSGVVTGQPGNLNVAMADFLGLAKVVAAQPGKTTKVTLGRLGSFSAVRAVTVPVAGGTVYISFRPNVAPDTRMPAWGGVQAHLQVMGSYYPTSYLLDMNPTQDFATPALGVGQSWQVPGAGFEVTVTSVNGTTSADVTVTPVEAVTLGSDLGFVPVTPARLVDTRTTSKVGPNKTLDVKVAGTKGVPADAKAVALNITAVNATGRTWVRAWPLGVPEPSSSTLNVHPGAVVAAATVLGVGSGGKVRLRNNVGTVDLIVDVTGYYTASGGEGFTPLPRAQRLYDSRTVSGGHASMSTRRLQVAGKAGVPANATAVMINVTSASARGPGHITVVPGGGDIRATSSVNLWPGADVANRATVPLSGGKIDVYLHGGPSGVVIDVVGWYGPSGKLRLTPVVPQRVVDTRVAGGALRQAESRTVAVRSAVASAQPVAAVATITATGQTANTHMKVGAAGTSLPPTSDLNTGPGRDQAAMALFVWDSAGRSVVYNNAGSTHLVIDVTAVFR